MVTYYLGEAEVDAYLRDLISRLATPPEAWPGVPNVYGLIDFTQNPDTADPNLVPFGDLALYKGMQEAEDAEEEEESTPV